MGRLLSVTLYEICGISEKETEPMKLRLTDREALALYRMLLRWEKTGRLTPREVEEEQLLWDLQCLLEKELEPVNEEVTGRWREE